MNNNYYGKRERIVFLLVMAIAVSSLLGFPGCFSILGKLIWSTGEVYAQNGIPVTDGLVLHLDAASIDGLDDGDKIDEWEDISGEDNHVTQAVEARKPVYKESEINDLPVVRFDEASSLLAPDSPSLSVSSRITVLAVAKPRITDTGARRILMKAHNAWAEPYYMYTLWSSGANIGFGVTIGGTRRWSNDAASIVAGNAYIWSGRYNGSHRHTYIDGEQVTVSNVPGGGDIDTNDEPLIIGASQQAPNSNTWFDGDIGEIIIFDRSLSDAELEQVHHYLGEKWLDWGPVQSLPADDIGSNEVNLKGHITSMKGAANVRVYFQYRKTGAPGWQSTSLVTRDEIGSFSRRVSSLDSEEEYEFRAVMRRGSENFFGEILTFTTPASLEDSLVLLLDASSIEGLNNDDAVDEWRDLSGKDNHVTQGDVSRQPVYRETEINGLPVVRFDGSSSLLAPSTESLNISPNITIVAVAKSSIAGGARRILIKGHTSWAEPFYMYTLFVNDTNNIGFGVNIGGTRQWSSDNAGMQVESPYIIGGRYNGVRRETFVDGSLVGSAPLTGVMSVNNEPLRIGATQDNPGTTWFQGDIAEIMLYDRALSDTELQEVTQMLGEKWLNWPPVVSKDVIGHFTIDGFSCFMVTGDVEVKSTPLVYNAREGSFTVSVRVKSGKPDYYDRNSIALYHNEEGQMEQVDRISTDRYLIDNSGAGGTTDNNFLFDIDEANKEIFYKVKFNNVINLNVSFTISTYISI